MEPPQPALAVETTQPIHEKEDNHNAVGPTPLNAAVPIERVKTDMYADDSQKLPSGTVMMSDEIISGMDDHKDEETIEIGSILMPIDDPMTGKTPVGSQDKVEQAGNSLISKTLTETVDHHPVVEAGAMMTLPANGTDTMDDILMPIPDSREASNAAISPVEAAGPAEKSMDKMTTDDPISTTTAPSTTMATAVSNTVPPNMIHSLNLSDPDPDSLHPRSAIPPQSMDVDDDRPTPTTTTPITNLSTIPSSDLRHMPAWSIDQVSAYLVNRFPPFGPQYVTLFKSHGIDGSRLCQFISYQSLQSTLGMTNPIHAFRIYRDIADLKLSAPALKTINTPCTRDGGTIQSRFIRFQWNELKSFFIQCKLLPLERIESIESIVVSVPPHNMQFAKMIDSLNGYHILTAKRDWFKNVLGLIDHEIDLILQINKRILNLNPLNRPSEQIMSSENKNGHSGKKNHLFLIQMIEKIWHERGENQSQTDHYKLLPQHLVDLRFCNFEDGPFFLRNESLNLKNVLEWTTEDCIRWLGTVESTTMKTKDVDYRERYQEYFIGVRLTGKELIHLTQWSFENFLGIRTKSHIRDLIKAIDKLRDRHLGDFGDQRHIKQWIVDHPKGRSRSSVRRRASTTSSNNNNQTGYSQSARSKKRRRIIGNQSTQLMSQESSGETMDQSESNPQGSSGMIGVGSAQRIGYPSIGTTTSTTRTTAATTVNYMETGSGYLGTAPYAMNGYANQYDYSGYHHQIRTKTPVYSYGTQPTELIRPSVEATRRVMAARETDDQDQKVSESGSKQEQSVTRGTAKVDTSALVCRVCGEGGDLMRCSVCRAVYYCGREHQIEDWLRHSEECK